MWLKLLPMQLAAYFQFVFFPCVKKPKTLFFKRNKYLKYWKIEGCVLGILAFLFVCKGNLKSALQWSLYIRVVMERCGYCVSVCRQLLSRI